VPTGFALAFLFTNQLERVLTDVRRVERWVVLVGMVALAAWIAIKAYRRERDLEREAVAGGPEKSGVL
jgi:hypothetical protein